MIAVLYLINRKIKKFFLDLISNTKILNISFFLLKLPTTKILQNLQGNKHRGLDSIKYGIYFVKEYTIIQS